MTELVRAMIRWAASDGPPNAAFIVALLTSPAKWSEWARESVSNYLGDSDGS